MYVQFTNCKQTIEHYGTQQGHVVNQEPCEFIILCVGQNRIYLKSFQTRKYLCMLEMQIVMGVKRPFQYTLMQNVYAVIIVVRRR